MIALDDLGVGIRWRGEMVFYRQQSPLQIITSAFFIFIFSEMVPKFHGFNVSVVMTCKELGIPLEVIRVKMTEAEHKSEYWLANMHPFGQVPVMIVSLL